MSIRLTESATSCESIVSSAIPVESGVEDSARRNEHTSGRERRLVLAMAVAAGLVDMACDGDAVRPTADVRQQTNTATELEKRAETLLVACGTDRTEADCAAAVGKNDAPRVPNLLGTVRKNLAAIEAKHGKLDKVKMEVVMPPEPAENKPGTTVGLATYGGTEYRFNCLWAEANGDLALDGWMIREKP